MRRLALAVVCGALLLAACSDETRQSPTEPNTPSPDALLGSCRPTKFPIARVSTLIYKVFPAGGLRNEALVRAAGIALLWDTCQASRAQKAAVDFVNFMNENSAALIGTQDQRNTLINLVLNGVGVPATVPTESPGDFGVGFFDPDNTDNTLIVTQNHTALVELEPGSFDEPTTIVVSRNSDDFQLTDFDGDQFPPYFDYNAINASGNHVLENNQTAIVGFCLLDPVITYPDNRRIGHNPVAGAPGFPFEILEPVDLQEAGLADELDCGNLEPNTAVIGGFGQGLPGLANAAWRSTRYYLGPVAEALLLPEALYAATLGTLPPPGGRAPSLSPFGIVEEPQDFTINFDVGPDGETPVAHGTVVNTLYASKGVTFQKAGTAISCASSPDVYASVNHTGSEYTDVVSQPNVVTLCGPSIASDISENTFGLIQADFIAPAAHVCIDVIPVPNDGVAPDDNFGRLEAFDGTGSSLGSVTSDPTVAGPLCVTATGIRRVQFSGAGSKFAWFDNLQVDFTAPSILF